MRRIPDWVADAAITLLIVLPEMVIFEETRQGAFSLSGLAVAIAAAAVLPWRRRWPFPVLGATIALFVAAAALGELGPATSFPVAVAVFGLVSRRNRRTSIISAAITILVLMAAALLSDSVGVLDPRVIQLAAVVGFAAALADGMKSRRAYIVAITERALRAEQTRESEARRRVAEERLRIARDLHDVVAHQIAVINLHAGVASAAVGIRPEEAERSLATIRGAARTVLSEIGDLLAMLRGASAGAEEIPFAPVNGMGQLNELLEEFLQTGLDVTFREVGSSVELPTATDLVAYRVIQEGLTNAHKHGSEHRAHLLIEYNPEAITITVTNPIGTRARPSQLQVLNGMPRPTGPAGHGLLGIAERVESVRGTVQTTPAGVSPFRLQAHLPLTISGTASRRAATQDRNVPGVAIQGAQDCQDGSET